MLKKLKPYSTFDATMRGLYLFIFCLLFLFIKGNSDAQAADSSISRYCGFASNTHQAKQHQKPFQKSANLHIGKSSFSTEFSYSEETKDDEENLSKKAIFGLKVTPGFCYSLFLENSKIVKKFSIPYCEHFSYTSRLKYLFIRVFRI